MTRGIFASSLEVGKVRGYTGSMKRLPGDGRELGIVRASEPCVRKIEKVEKTVIRKKVTES